MSDKLECPGCHSYTSAVARAVFDDQPCPRCGLSAEVIRQVDNIHVSRATEAVKEQARDALVRAGKAERDAALHKSKLDEIRALLDKPYDPEQ